MEEYSINSENNYNKKNQSKNNNSFIIITIIGVTFLVFVLFGLIGLVGDVDDNITYENYMKIENGMTYNQVKNILGEGELTTTSSYMGYTMSYYTWTDYGESIVVCFENGKVTSKSQFGL